MQFWKQNWPSILAFWIAIVITAFAIRFLFFNEKTENSNMMTLEEMLDGLQQNDTRLLDYIASNHIFPPLLPTIAYNLKSLEDEEQSLNNHYIWKILNEKINGFFVEYRAYDGTFLSKTLALEQNYNWTGVLIEPDPSMFPKLVSKHRKAWLSNACLSPDTHSQKIDFMQSKQVTVINSHPITDNTDEIKLNPNASKDEIKLISREIKKSWHKVRISCFPLFSILSSLKITTINYLILNAQGLELQILLNIPWDSVFIEVLSVDVQWIPEGAETLIAFMKVKDYRLVFQVHQDYIFAHQNLRFLDTVGVDDE